MTTKSIQIHSKAPTRIDLAGGTVDIWPIYLFLRNATTLNLGIDLFAEAQLTESSSSSGKVLLKSQDQKNELELCWEDLAAETPPRVHPSLELHAKLLRFFVLERVRNGSHDFKTSFSLSTIARSPAGAGLGGSSTLAIAMIGALATWARGGIDPVRDGERFIEIVRDTETTVIKVPAGLQDYYGAMYGGLQRLQWKAGNHERSWLGADILSEMQSRLLLFYSGQSRNSGINNWALFKSFIDGQGPVRDQFAQINEATHELDAALLAKDWKNVGKAIAAEWEVRRKLAPGITTPELDQAFENARREGASAGKICGAGGGGCFFVYLDEPNENLKKKVIEKVVTPSIRSLPFKAVPRGLEVQVSRA